MTPGPSWYCLRIEMDQNLARAFRHVALRSSASPQASTMLHQALTRAGLVCCIVVTGCCYSLQG